MKMKYIYSIFLFLLSTVALSQAESEIYKKYFTKKQYGQGFVLLKDSTKVNGLFTLESGVPCFIKLVTKEGELKSFNCSQILAYQKKGKYMEYDGFKFYELIKRGKQVSYFERIVATTSSVPTTPGIPSAPGMIGQKVEKYFRKTGSMQFERIRSSKFDKDMVKCFTDCPTLLKNLERGVYTYDQAEAIVDVYDRCELSQQ